MKKLLSLLATVSLFSTSTTSIVACGNENNNPIDENEDISTIISVTNLGNIRFHSFAGNDVQTQTEIINQIINLNPNVGNAQIDISNIMPINGTASISVLGFNGALTVYFTSPHALTLTPISFPSSPNSILQLQDGTTLVTGGTTTNGSNSFLASINLSNSQTQILAQGSPAFPSIPRSIIELQDGRILVAGGSDFSGANSFLALVNLSNSQIQILADGSTNAFPSTPQSMIELQNGTILVAGGNDTSGIFSFLASINLSNPANPQIQILAQGSTSAFPSIPHSITQLQNGTILVAGGSSNTGANSFLASINLSNPANPVQILAQGAFPSIPRSMIKLQDGTILVTGGSNINIAGSNPFLASVDLSNYQIQTLAQGSSILLPPAPQSMIKLQNGTILIVGTSGASSLLRGV